MADVQSVIIPVSPGEALDKFSILKIKLMKIKDQEKQSFIVKEIEMLQSSIQLISSALADSYELYLDQLTSINLSLWEIEDRIRQKEASLEFREEFIELARSVYKTNDMRSAVKNKINCTLRSAIAEQKQHPAY